MLLAIVVGVRVVVVMWRIVSGGVMWRIVSGGVVRRIVSRRVVWIAPFVVAIVIVVVFVVVVVVVSCAAHSLNVYSRIYSYTI